MEHQAPEQKPADFSEWETDRLIQRLQYLTEHLEIVKDTKERADTLEREINYIVFELTQRDLSIE